MAERPILFSGPMVRAILEGRKTQTRRVVRFHPSSGYIVEPGGRRRWHRDDPEAVAGCPYGVPGDTLWVRETWAGERGRILYAADNPSGFEPDRPKWKMTWTPSIHMPRWASRLTLRVLKVRPERLQEISEADAQAEGMPFDSWAGDRGYRDCFEIGWDHINGKRAPWASNPWVWVIEFEPVRATANSAPPREAGGRGEPRG